jgi:hypothetical protein
MSGPLDFGDDDDRRAVEPRASTRRDVPSQGRPPAAGPRYVWLTGVVGLVLVIVLLVSIVSHGTGRGARGLVVGSAMPPFAVPLVDSTLDADANIATRRDQGQAGHEPACTVHGRGVLNGCDLWRRTPALVVFFTTAGGCIAQLDRVERVRRSLPGLSVAAIAVRGSRSELRRRLSAHRLGFPVGYDRDGALANLYHVQVCPQMTFATPGGRVSATTFGRLSEPALATRVRRLLR